MKKMSFKSKGPESRRKSGVMILVIAAAVLLAISAIFAAIGIALDGGDRNFLDGLIAAVKVSFFFFGAPMFLHGLLVFFTKYDEDELFKYSLAWYYISALGSNIFIQGYQMPAVDSFVISGAFVLLLLIVVHDRIIERFS